MLPSSRSPIPAPRARARRARGARAGAALIGLLLGVGVLGPAAASAQTAPKPDPLADADQTVAQLRRQADAASGRYVATRIFQAALELTASFYSSQMVAMKNATENAQDLIEDLTLTYNKVRQANITREMIEIATGAQAS